MNAIIEEHHHEDHHHGPDKGIMRWVFTTNHKDIGTLYLWFSFLMFLTGGVLALGIPCRIIPARPAASGTRILQPNDHYAWTHNGVWCRHARLCWTS